MAATVAIPPVQATATIPQARTGSRREVGFRKNWIFGLPTWMGMGLQTHLMLPVQSSNPHGEPAGPSEPCRQLSRIISKLRAAPPKTLIFRSGTTPGLVIRQTTEKGSNRLKMLISVSITVETAISAQPYFQAGPGLQRKAQRPMRQMTGTPNRKKRTGACRTVSSEIRKPCPARGCRTSISCQAQPPSQIRRTTRTTSIRRQLP